AVLGKRQVEVLASRLESRCTVKRNFDWTTNQRQLVRLGHSRGKTMRDIRTRWLTFYSEHVEQASKEMFGHVEKMIVATLVISAGAHVSSTDPAILLFGYLRHSFIGRGVELFGIVLLFLNFLDGFYKLSKLNWHFAYQIVMSLCYIVLSVRLVQLILAFRGE
ncbi:MAG: hypothetical protein ACRCTX_17775, partial [Afipia sp.]